MRSRAKWIGSVENNSKFFCNFENSNFVSKCMTKLINNDGNQITDQTDIVGEVRTFYKTLHSKRDSIDIDIDNVIDEQVSKETV